MIRKKNQEHAEIKRYESDMHVWIYVYGTDGHLVSVTMVSKNPHRSHETQQQEAIQSARPEKGQAERLDQGGNL